MTSLPAATGNAGISSFAAKVWSFNGHRKSRLIGIGVITLLIIGIFTWGFWPSRSNSDVKVLFSHFQNVPGGQVAVFQVANIGKRSVTMYGLHGGGAALPVYLVLWRNGTNWDWDSSPGIDPRLTQPIILPPGAKMTMPTFLPGLDRWMVGVHYSTALYTRVLPDWVRGHESLENFIERRMSIAWSDPITLSSPPSNIAAPMGKLTNLITAGPTGKLTNQSIMRDN